VRVGVLLGVLVGVGEGVMDAVGEGPPNPEPLSALDKELPAPL